MITLYDLIDGDDKYDNKPGRTLHPLPAFRQAYGQDVSEEASGEEDDIEIVFRYVEPSKDKKYMCAFALLSDGGRIPAIRYEKIEYGFATAFFNFKDTESELHTGVPASSIIDDGAHLQLKKMTAAKSKAGMKRPAAASAKPASKKPAAAAAPDEEEEEGGDEAKEEETEHDEGEADGVETATDLDAVIKAGWDMLPECAQKQVHLEPGKKTYTIDPNAASDLADLDANGHRPSKIQVTFAGAKGPKRFFYLTNIRSLPDGASTDHFKINAQNGMQLTWMNQNRAAVQVIWETAVSLCKYQASVA
eukprot:9475683-Pyramimonas_sp.AAC.1